MDSFDVLITGSGHGGTHAATALRARGFTGSIGIASDEAELPYQRPPLSKGYLAGDIDRERLLLRPRTFWAEQGVTLLSGHRIDGVDPARRQVLADDGTRVGFRSLVWAAGSVARTLDCPGHELAGIHTLRSRADADLLQAAHPLGTMLGIDDVKHLFSPLEPLLRKGEEHAILLLLAVEEAADVAEPAGRCARSMSDANGGSQDRASR